MLDVIMLSVIMLDAIMLSVVKNNVVMPSAMAPVPVLEVMKLWSIELAMYFLICLKGEWDLTVITNPAFLGQWNI